MNLTVTRRFVLGACGQTRIFLCRGEIAAIVVLKAFGASV